MKAIYIVPATKKTNIVFQNCMISISDNEGENPDDLVKEREDETIVWEEF